MPAISVVIPAYNAGLFITEAIESVLRQSFRDYELIVIDDGSTDNTKEKISVYADKIKILVQENSGQFATLNRGIRESKGELVAFLDSDDIWEEHHLARLLDGLRQSKTARLIYGSAFWVDANKNPLMHLQPKHKLPVGWAFADLFQHNYITMCTVLVKKETIIECGWFDEDPNLANAGDWDMWLRISAKYPITADENVYFFRRWHDNNASKNVSARAIGIITAISKAKQLIIQQKVDINNKPDLIDVHERMRRLYFDMAVGLFSANEFATLRSIGFNCMRYGYATPQFLVRWMLTLLPLQATRFIADSVRIGKRLLA